MSENAEGQWYYAIAGGQQGPVPEAVLKGLLAAGKVSTAVLVWRPGMAQWTAASSVPGLVPAGGPARTPPPVPPRYAT